jgi:hypothetical protein
MYEGNANGQTKRGTESKHFYKISKTAGCLYGGFFGVYGIYLPYNKAWHEFSKSKSQAVFRIVLWAYYRHGYNPYPAQGGAYCK